MPRRVTRVIIIIIFFFHLSRALVHNLDLLLLLFSLALHSLLTHRLPLQVGITGSLQVKRQLLLFASEAAEIILRVHNILKAAPRKRAPDHGHC